MMQKVHFRLTSVAQKRFCLSFLLIKTSKKCPRASKCESCLPKGQVGIQVFFGALSEQQQQTAYMALTFVFGVVLLFIFQQPAEQALFFAFFRRARSRRTFPAVPRVSRSPRPLRARLKNAKKQRPFCKLSFSFEVSHCNNCLPRCLFCLVTQLSSPAMEGNRQKDYCNK